MNPGFEKSDYKKLLQYQMIFNIRKGIKHYKKKHHRLNFEWINHDAIGIEVLIP